MFAPHELMFGRKPRLPIDTVFLSAKPDSFVGNNVSDYISDLRKRMEETRRVVQQHLERTKKKQPKYYNRKAKQYRYPKVTECSSAE